MHHGGITSSILSDRPDDPSAASPLLEQREGCSSFHTPLPKVLLVPPAEVGSSHPRRLASDGSFPVSHSVAEGQHALFRTSLEDHQRTDAFQAAEEYQRRMQEKRDVIMETLKKKRLDEIDPVRPVDSFNVTHRALLGRCWDRRAPELIPVSFVQSLEDAAAETLTSQTTVSLSHSNLENGSTSLPDKRRVPRRSHWFSVGAVSTEMVIQSLYYQASRNLLQNAATPNGLLSPGSTAVKGTPTRSGEGGSLAMPTSSSMAGLPLSGNASGQSPSSEEEPALLQTTFTPQQLMAMSREDRERLFNYVISRNPRYSGIKDASAFRLSQGVSQEKCNKFLRKRGLEPAVGVTAIRWNRVEYFHPTLHTLIRAVARTKGSDAEEDLRSHPLASLGLRLSQNSDLLQESFSQRLIGEAENQSFAQSIGSANDSFVNHQRWKVGSRSSTPARPPNQHGASRSRSRDRYQHSGVLSEQLHKQFPEDSVLSLALGIPSAKLATLSGVPHAIRSASSTLHTAPAWLPLPKGPNSPKRPSGAGASTSMQSDLVAVSISCFSVSIDPFQWQQNKYIRFPIDVDGTKKSTLRDYGEGVITDIMYGGIMVVQCSSVEAVLALEQMLMSMTWTEARTIRSIIGEVEKSYKEAGHLDGAARPNNASAPAVAPSPETSRDHQYRIWRRIGGRPMRDAVELQEISIYFDDDALRKETVVLNHPGHADPTPRLSSGSTTTAAETRSAQEFATDPEVSPSFSRVASAWVNLPTISTVLRTWALHLLANPEYAQPTSLFLQKFAGIAPVLQRTTLWNMCHDANVPSSTNDDSEDNASGGEFFETEGMSYKDFESATTIAPRIPKYNRFYTSRPNSVAETEVGTEDDHDKSSHREASAAQNSASRLSESSKWRGRKPGRRLTAIASDLSCPPHSNHPLGDVPHGEGMGPKCHSQDTLPGDGLSNYHHLSLGTLGDDPVIPSPTSTAQPRITPSRAESPRSPAISVSPQSRQAKEEDPLAQSTAYSSYSGSPTTLSHDTFVFTGNFSLVSGAQSTKRGSLLKAHNTNDSAANSTMAVQLILGSPATSTAARRKKVRQKSLLEHVASANPSSPPEGMRESDVAVVPETANDPPAKALNGKDNRSTSVLCRGGLGEKLSKTGASSPGKRRRRKSAGSGKKSQRRSRNSSLKVSPNPVALTPQDGQKCQGHEMTLTAQPSMQSVCSATSSVSAVANLLRQREESERLWNMAMLEVKALNQELEDMRQMRHDAEDELQRYYDELRTLNRSFLPHGNPQELDFTLMYLKTAIHESDDLPSGRLFLSHPDWLSLLAAIWATPNHSIRTVDIAWELSWGDIPKLGILSGLLYRPSAAEPLECLMLQASELLGSAPASELSTLSSRREDDDPANRRRGGASGGGGLLSLISDRLARRRRDGAAKSQSGHGGDSLIFVPDGNPIGAGFGGNCPPYYVTPVQARDTLLLLLCAVAKNTVANEFRMVLQGLPVTTGASITAGESTTQRGISGFLESATKRRGESKHLMLQSDSMQLDPFLVYSSPTFGSFEESIHRVGPGPLGNSVTITSDAPHVADASFNSRHNATLNSSVAMMSVSTVTDGGESQIFNEDRWCGHSLLGASPITVHVHSEERAEWMRDGNGAEQYAFCNVFYHTCGSLTAVVAQHRSAETATDELPDVPPPPHYHHPCNAVHNNPYFYISGRRCRALKVLEEETQTTMAKMIGKAELVSHLPPESSDPSLVFYPSDRVFGLQSAQEEHTVLQAEERQLRDSANGIWEALRKSVKHFNKAQLQLQRHSTTRKGKWPFSRDVSTTTSPSPSPPPPHSLRQIVLER